MTKLLKKYFTNIGPQVYFQKKIFYSDRNLIGKNFQYYSLGTKNKNKTFYVINRSPGSGL